MTSLLEYRVKFLRGGWLPKRISGFRLGIRIQKGSISDRKSAAPAAQ